MRMLPLGTSKCGSFLLPVTPLELNERQGACFLDAPCFAHKRQNRRPLPGFFSELFGHFIYSSGSAALSGECIMDYHQNGKMYLTNNKTEVSYYRQRALDILSKAFPLMDIYRIESENAFSAFVKKRMYDFRQKKIHSFRIAHPHAFRRIAFADSGT